MSRLGKRPVKIENGVECNINNDLIVVKGPKGSLQLEINSRKVQASVDNDVIQFTCSSNTKEEKAKFGLYRAIVSNMIEGVTKGFTKSLNLVGVGYRVQQKGSAIELSLGFSHPIHFEPPKDVVLQIEGTTKILVSGIDKHMVGQVAANIRSLKKPDPYKGKGILFEGEKIIRKQGKSVKK